MGNRKANLRIQVVVQIQRSHRLTHLYKWYHTHNKLKLRLSKCTQLQVRAHIVTDTAKLLRRRRRSFERDMFHLISQLLCRSDFCTEKQKEKVYFQKSAVLYELIIRCALKSNALHCSDKYKEVPIVLSFRQEICCWTFHKTYSYCKRITFGDSFF